MTDQFYTAPGTQARLHTGPLGSHIDTFAALLSQQGYARTTIRCQLRLVADLSHWLEDRGLGIEDLDEEKILESLEDSQRNRDFIDNYKAVFRKLLRHLRGLSLVPAREPEADDSAIGCLVEEFGQYLVQERGLSQATLASYLPAIRRFLAECFGDEVLELYRLNAAHVMQFMLRCARRISRRHAKLVASALRSFLRYLRLRGDITTNLELAVPTVAEWRLSTLPRSLQPQQIKALLDGCDQSTTVGRRDYAILLLVARLGLRGGEVVALRLEDLDWQAGEFTIRGKGPRLDRLPIPKDVGAALANYLRQDRPSCRSRKVFIRSRAPYRGFANSIAICSIMKRALERAGLDPVHKGAHLLRHSLATEMLRNGASMVEIGQILRHRSPSTTEIYTKVDVTALRELAQPWPGGER